MRTLEEITDDIRNLKDRVQFHHEPISDDPLEFLRVLLSDLEDIQYNQHDDCLSQDDCDQQVRDAESIIEDKLREEIKFLTEQAQPNKG